MARKGPTIMQGPFDPALVRGKPLKEHLNVYIVPMDIVQMHYVGVDLV